MSGRSPAPLTHGQESEKVLERMKSDKPLEELQQKALQRLKDDPQFNEHVKELVAKSEAIKERRDMQRNLKDEIEKTVIDDAAKRLFEILNSKDNGVGVELEASVQTALIEILTEHYSSSSAAPDRK